MDEQTPPLAVYPVPKGRPPKNQSPLTAQRAGYLLAGIVLGGGLVAATLHFARPVERIVYRDLPATAASSSTASNLPAKPLGQDVPPIVKPGEKSATADPGSNVPSATGPGAKLPKDAAAAKTGPTIQPYNPFAGNIAEPPKEISGHVAAGSPPTLPKATSGSKPSVAAQENEASAAPKGLLITMRLDVSDPDAAVKALQGLASKEGGSAIQFDDAAAKLDPEGAILFVPAAKAEETQKEIAKVGSIVVSDRWTGTSADRLDRLEAPAENRISDLHVQRQELLVKYFEDAPQIKHIDEDSARIGKCLAALRAHHPGPNTAVLKIKFLS